jgi:predicted DNA-binding transcriptional regulator AlpA
MAADPAVRIAPDPDDTPASADPVARLRDRPEAPAVELPPLLIDMAGLSKLLARSEASLYRDESAGRLPAGLKLGASKRWRYAEIVAWVDAGAPDRKTWEALKAARNANGRPRQAGR